MKPREIFKMKAEADTRHLILKLDETEADAIAGIAKSEEKINQLKNEIQACKSKKGKLNHAFEQLKAADDTSWDEANNGFIEAIESLEDKNVFKNKTEEWFNNVRDVVGELKSEIKQKVNQW